MSGPTIGALFAGYGGLEMGVTAVVGGRVAWHVEIDQAASKVLAHRYPGVPNHGDITKVNWSQVEPVDVLCGGFPCQDISNAGKRAGIEGARSGLWSEFARAIRALRPGLVVVENVAALLGRGMGRVLGDLAAAGYDAQWCCLRAADVGAPHGRARLFLAAHPADGTGHGEWARPQSRQGSAAVADADDFGHEWAGSAWGRWPGSADGGLLPTPTARDSKGANQRGDASCLTGALMPTPRATDGTKGGPGQRGSSGDLMLPSAVTLLPTPLRSDAGPRGGTTGYGMRDWARAHSEAQRLLPTPTSKDRDASGGNPHTTGTHGTTLTDATVRQPDRWGIYAAAIHRWENLTRPAPPPTMLSRKGTPQLSPRFSEWMLGLPDGWVTDVPGLTRNDQLRILGNGVVPQQCAAALRWLLGDVCGVAA